MSTITIIAFHPTGYELQIEVSFAELNTTLQRLAAKGYKPSRELTYTAEGLPLCPRHGVPMKRRSKQGDEWFSHKLTDPTTGEEVYCRGYPSASSPGYDILLPTHVEAVAGLEVNNGTTNGSKVEKPKSAPLPAAPQRLAKTQDATPSNGRTRRQPSLAELDDDAFNEALFG